MSCADQSSGLVDITIMWKTRGGKISAKDVDCDRHLTRYRIAKGRRGDALVVGVLHAHLRDNGGLLGSCDRVM
jgi:hypothetical protein